MHSGLPSNIPTHETNAAVYFCCEVCSFPRPDPVLLLLLKVALQSATTFSSKPLSAAAGSGTAVAVVRALEKVRLSCALSSVNSPAAKPSLSICGGRRCKSSTSTEETPACAAGGPPRCRCHVDVTEV